MDEQRDLDWVANFNDAPDAPPERRLGGIIALSVLFGGGGLAALALVIAAIARASAEDVGAQQSSTPTTMPVPAVTQSATRAPSHLPAGCEGLYSEAMSVTLEQIGFELGSDYDGDWHSGSADEELRELLDAPALDCYWSNGKAGMLTKVTEIGAQQQAAAIDRLEALGFTEKSEHGGVRYFIERTAATGSSGESHFFREGTWFATHWLGHGQYGYTADMVRTVFAD